MPNGPLPMKHGVWRDDGLAIREKTKAERGVWHGGCIGWGHGNAAWPREGRRLPGKAQRPVPGRETTPAEDHQRIGHAWGSLQRLSPPVGD